MTHQPYNWEEVKLAEAGGYENLDFYTSWRKTFTGPGEPYPNLGLQIQRFRLTPEDAKTIGAAKFINNSSFVVILTVTGTKPLPSGHLFTQKFLFGGDMETAGWEALLKIDAEFRDAVKGVTFFVVSHHGHESGFSSALFDAMGGKPFANIVSIHRNDPHADDRYKEYAVGVKLDGVDRRMLTTRCDGTITVDVNESGQFWVSAEHLGDNDILDAAARVLGF